MAINLFPVCIINKKIPLERDFKFYAFAIAGSRISAKHSKK